MSDFRWAIRLALRRPGFTAAVVLILGVTMAAAATVYGLATAVLWTPLPFAEESRLVFVWEETSSNGDPSPSRVTAGRFSQWRGHQSSFASMAAFNAAEFTTAGADGTVVVRGVRVTEGYFDTLGIAPAVGRTFTPGDHAPGHHRTVVLSHGFWQQWFAGRPDAVGATLHLNGQPYVVLGVMPPAVFPGWPVNPARVTLDPDARDLWVPIAAAPGWDANARAHLYGVVARLKPGVSLAQAGDDLNRLGQGADPHGAWITPFRDQFVRDARQPLVLLLATALALVLVACLNLAALQVSRMEGRRAEIGIRMALGAGRARLARQLATETLLIVVMGGAVGALAARVALVHLPSLLPPTVPIMTTPGLDIRVWLFGVLLAFGAGIVVGGWPVIRSLGAAPSPRGTVPAVRRSIHRSLVVVQVSLATALVVAASLLAQSLGAVSRQDPGFVLDRVLVADVAFSGSAYETAPSVASAERRLTAVLAGTPGIRGAAVAYDHPLDANWLDSVTVAGTVPGSDDLRGVAQLRIVSPAYFDVMGVAVLDGRVFHERDDLTATGALVVNEAFVRETNLGGLVGRRAVSRAPSYTWGEAAPTEYTIVGVVENERFRGLELPSEPAVYISTRQFPQRGLTVLLRTDGEPLGTATALRAAVREVDPAAPVSRIRALDDILAEQLVARRVTTDVIGGLAGAALALSALGLYGLLAMLVSLRTREIGVRLALGALPGAIARQVVGDSLRSAAAGVALGLLLAVVTGRLVERLLVGVSAADPTTLAVVSLTFLVVAALAALLPARRATRVDPVRALTAD